MYEIPISIHPLLSVIQIVSHDSFILKFVIVINLKSPNWSHLPKKDRVNMHATIIEIFRQIKYHIEKMQITF